LQKYERFERVVLGPWEKQLRAVNPNFLNLTMDWNFLVPFLNLFC